MNRSESPAADLVVVGLGPAGRALVHRAASAGLDVLGVDPHPNRQWTPTYSAWADELPDWLPSSAIATTTRELAAWTTRRQSIDRAYCVLNTAALQAALAVDQSSVVTGTASAVQQHSVTLMDGTTVAAQTVVDARGSAGLPDLAEQTAFGVVVDRADGEALLDGAGAWFMDWRTDNGTDPGDTPSFLYAVALDSDRILLEETCLVGSPALDSNILRKRLHVRLRERGLTLTGDEPVERVKFAVQPPPRDRSDRGVHRFGARSSLMHPATGYSVAASLAVADSFLERLADGKTAITPSIWAVQKLRNLGLRTALNLDADQIPYFFASFFDLTVPQQSAYLSGRSDLSGTVGAMTRMFPTLPTGARMAIARTVVGR